MKNNHDRITNVRLLAGIIILGALVIGIGVFAGASVLRVSDQANRYARFAPSKLVMPAPDGSPAEPLPESESREITLSAVGDVMLARGVGRVLRETPLQDVVTEPASMFSDSDMVFANLESVLASTDNHCGKPYCFQADPDTLEVLVGMGVTHASVSNNHNYDYGREAFDESLAHLRSADIQPVGGYVNANAPAVMRVRDKTFVFLAFDAATYRMGARQVEDALREAPDGDVYIASFHWGEEYVHHPNANQRALAHAAIDAGADAVLGHHPHVLQGIERYGDGLILYSLGNFFFDQSGEDQTESLVARLSWQGGQRRLELVPARIRGWLPKQAAEQERERTLSRLAEWSDPALREAIRSGELSW